MTDKRRFCDIIITRGVFSNFIKNIDCGPHVCAVYINYNNYTTAVLLWFVHYNDNNMCTSQLIQCRLYNMHVYTNTIHRSLDDQSCIWRMKLEFYEFRWPAIAAIKTQYNIVLTIDFPTPNIVHAVILLLDLRTYSCVVHQIRYFCKLLIEKRFVSFAFYNINFMTYRSVQ